MGRNRDRDLDAQDFATALVDRVQGAERMAALGRIGHKVEHPDLVLAVRSSQWLPQPLRQTPLGAPRQIELHRAIPSKPTLGVDAIAVKSQPVVQLLKTPARAACYQTISSSITGRSGSMLDPGLRYHAVRDNLNHPRRRD